MYKKFKSFATHSKLTIEDGTNKPIRSKQHKQVSLEAPGEATYSPSQRFVGHRKVAVGGIPLDPKTTNFDDDVWAEEHVTEFANEYALEAWELHATQMYLEGNDEALDVF